MSEIRVQALRCGTLSAAGEAFVPGVDGSVLLQVWAFVIEHPAGTVLFDSGMHPAVSRDPKGWLGSVADLFEVGYEPDETVAAKLERAGVDADGIDIVVASHFHFDHVGGVALAPQARIVVQEAELLHARGGDTGYYTAEWDTGQDLQVVRGEHDVFGDGRVLCDPTFGHTPGHQSLRVRLDGGDLCLTSDACYLRQSLEERALPLFGWDLDKQAVVLDRFARYEAEGSTLVFGHDPVLSPSARQLLAAEH